MVKDEMIFDDDNEYDDDDSDTEEDFTPTTTPEEVKKKCRPMPACKKVGKPSTSSDVNEVREMKKRKSVARKLHINKEDSRTCQFCCLKFENWNLFSSHVKDKHVDKLEERKQLRVKK